jgi:outer membrane immunogenic protein
VKKLLLVSALCFVGATRATFAADLVDSCADNWSGLYGGVHAGYAFGNVNTATLGDVNVEGFVGGVLAGYNFQTCNLVFGVESDFGFSPDIDGTNSAINDFDIEPNGHLRGRIGLPMDNLMPFLAAGLAIADADIRTVPGVGDSHLHVGFTVGAGLDFAVNENVIVRGEYLFDAYGSETYAPGGKVDFDTHTLRAALIWKF